MNKENRIAVIICAYNAEKVISRCLRSVLAQKFNDFELIVIDDGSTDNTYKILEDLCSKYNIIVHRNKSNIGLMASRNIGLDLAVKSDIIAYTDSDCAVKPSWLEELIKPFSRDDGITITGGKIIDPEPENYWGIVMKGIYYLSSESCYLNRIIGCNMAFRKSFLIDNKFDETLKYGGDETDLCYKAIKQGYKIYYQDTAEVIHYHRNSLKALVKQRFLLGIGNYYIRLKHKVFPFVSIKSAVLIATILLFTLYLTGFVKAYYWMLLLFLYLGRIFFEDYRTKKKKFYENLVSFPGKVLTTAIEDIGYIYGIFYIFFKTKISSLLRSSRTPST